MSLDLLCLIVIAAFTVLGYLTGILRQIFKVACIVLAFFLSGPTAKFLNAYLGTSEHVGPFSCYLLVRIGAWVGLYVLLRIVAFYLNRAIGAAKGGVLMPINRRLGGYLGFLEGMGLCLVMLWALQIWINDEQTILFPQWRQKAQEAFYASWAQSSLAWRLASHYNPLIDFNLVGKLRVLSKALQYREDIWPVLSHDPSVQALLNHPKVKALMKDEAFRNAMQEKDYMAILRNPGFKAMMSDPGVQALMRNVHVFDILKESLDKRAKREP